MSDARLQDLRRRAATGASAEYEAVLLRERVRAGELAPRRVSLAAHCGHGPSREASGWPVDVPAEFRELAPGWDEARRLGVVRYWQWWDQAWLVSWARGISAWGSIVRVRASVAAIAPAAVILARLQPQVLELAQRVGLACAAALAWAEAAEAVSSDQFEPGTGVGRRIPEHWRWASIVGPFGEPVELARPSDEGTSAGPGCVRVLDLPFPYPELLLTDGRGASRLAYELDHCDWAVNRVYALAGAVTDAHPVRQQVSAALIEWALRTPTEEES